MHSYLTWRVAAAGLQPTTRCSWPRSHRTSTRRCCARTCSRPSTIRRFQLAVLEEAMANFRRYFFIMPTLARLRARAPRAGRAGRGADRRAARATGWPISSRRATAPDVELDRDRVGITWAAVRRTSTSRSTSTSTRPGSRAPTRSPAASLDGDDGAAARYLEFLAAGELALPARRARAGRRRPALAGSPSSRHSPCSHRSSTGSRRWSRWRSSRWRSSSSRSPTPTTRRSSLRRRAIEQTGLADDVRPAGSTSAWWRAGVLEAVEPASQRASTRRDRVAAAPAHARASAARPDARRVSPVVPGSSALPARSTRGATRA